MTRDEIIRMAREAGSIDSEEVIETVWRAFSAVEREACAKVCDDNALKVAAGLFRRGQNDYFGGHYFARAIRARSKA